MSEHLLKLSFKTEISQVLNDIEKFSYHWSQIFWLCGKCFLQPNHLVWGLELQNLFEPWWCKKACGKEGLACTF